MTSYIVFLIDLVIKIMTRAGRAAPKDNSKPFSMATPTLEIKDDK